MAPRVAIAGATGAGFSYMSYKATKDTPSPNKLVMVGLGAAGSALMVAKLGFMTAPDVFTAIAGPMCVGATAGAAAGAGASLLKPPG